MTGVKPDNTAHSWKAQIQCLNSGTKKLASALQCMKRNCCPWHQNMYLLKVHLSNKRYVENLWAQVHGKEMISLSWSTNNNCQWLHFCDHVIVHSMFHRHQLNYNACHYNKFERVVKPVFQQTWRVTISFSGSWILFGKCSVNSLWSSIIDLYWSTI